MNKYVPRVTLTSPAGSLVVTPPKGIEDIPLTLMRDKDLFSVLENFKGELTFVLEAVEFINAAKLLGIDTKLDILVEISEDFAETFETMFAGSLDLPNHSTIHNPTEYQVILQCTKDDVWRLLFSRKEIDVDVVSTTDLDGNAVAPATLMTINMTTQVVRRHTRTEMWLTTDSDFTDLIFPMVPVSSYVPAMDLPKDIFNEITTKYNYPPTIVIITTDPALFPIIEAVEAATVYDIDISIVLSDSTYKNRVPATLNISFGRNIHADLPVTSFGTPFTRTDLGTNGVDGRTVFTYTGTEADITQGTRFHVTGGIDFASFDAYVVPNDIYAEQSYFDIIAHTIYPPTNCEAIRVGEGFDAIVKRITGGDNFHSDFFDVTGCGYDFVNMMGLHLRGFLFSAKPFADNLMARFKAACTVWNLGLGYELVMGVRKVVVEERSHFYDSSADSIKLSYIPFIKEDFKKEEISNAIEIGYSKWNLTQSGSLIDDPQTQHTYSTPFKYVGQKITVFCDWIAASLMFELTRRATVKPGQTFDTDNDIFLLAIDGTVPKVSYVTSSDLLDPDGRYNKELTPGRAFLRWFNTFNIGIQDSYIGQFFKFVSGVGNFLTSIEVATTDCAGSDVAIVTENQDFEITGNAIYNIKQVQFSFDLNWTQYKLIRDNPNKTIGISVTGADHESFFIDTIDFYLFQRKANFTLFRKL